MPMRETALTYTYFFLLQFSQFMPDKRANDTLQHKLKSGPPGSCNTHSKHRERFVLDIKRYAGRNDIQYLTNLHDLLPIQQLANERMTVAHDDGHYILLDTCKSLFPVLVAGTMEDAFICERDPFLQGGTEWCT